MPSNRKSLEQTELRGPVGVVISRQLTTPDTTVQKQWWEVHLLQMSKENKEKV